MKRELDYFLTALAFFTRIPVGSACNFSQENLNRCNRYFPLVGLLVGGISAGLYWLFILLFPIPVALLGTLLAMILVTGAFHEDGFADVCDGFGGGWTKEQTLNIMKDSRLGTYGSFGLIGMFLMKYVTLLELRHSHIFIIMIVGHTISRVFAVTTMYALDYVREDEVSKSKPITKNLHPNDLVIAILLGSLSLLLLPHAVWLLAIVPPFIAKWLMERWFKKHIGGYTGDCLGAIQQITEVLFYLSILVISLKM